MNNSRKIVKHTEENKKHLRSHQPEITFIKFIRLSFHQQFWSEMLWVILKNPYREYVWPKLFSLYH